MEDQHPLKEYEFLPTLPELCEKDFKELRDEIGYIFTLYGFALGYLAGVHPAKAWLALGTSLIKNLASITKEDWEDLQIKIANKLEERSIKRGS